VQGWQLAVGIRKVNGIAIHNGHITHTCTAKEFSGETTHASQPNDQYIHVF
jgi:hypothetical protein